MFDPEKEDSIVNVVAIFLPVPWIEPKALFALGKCSTTELCLSPKYSYGKGRGNHGRPIEAEEASTVSLFREVLVGRW